MKKPLTEKLVIDVIASHSSYNFHSSYWVFPNIHFGHGEHECDLLLINRKNMGVTEIEIKLNLNDLKNNYKKTHLSSVHKIGKDGNEFNFQEYQKKESQIMYFYYAIPEDLIEEALKWIPDEVGVLKIVPKGMYSKISNFRKAKKNLYAKALDDKVFKNLMDKWYWKYWNYRMEHK